MRCRTPGKGSGAGATGRNARPTGPSPGAGVALSSLEVAARPSGGWCVDQVTDWSTVVLWGTDAAIARCGGAGALGDATVRARPSRRSVSTACVPHLSPMERETGDAPPYPQTRRFNAHDDGLVHRCGGAGAGEPERRSHPPHHAAVQTCVCRTLRTKRMRAVASSRRRGGADAGSRATRPPVAAVG
jgi:hypothetical protein